MAKAIWLSFDLGIRGDYEALYTWLDNHEAKECGDSLAFLRYEFSGSLREALASDLRQAISVTSHTRIYVIFEDPKTKRPKGSFVFGGRKAPPWSGYAPQDEVIDADEA